MSQISINRQMEEMENLLSSLKRESEELIGLNDGDVDQVKKKKKKIVIDDAQKRLRSQSSWAKSQVPSAASVDRISKSKRIEGEELQSFNTDQAVSAILRQPPAFSFPKSHYLPKQVLENEYVDLDIPGPQRYNVNDTKSSTRKRGYAAMFPSEKREVFPVPKSYREEDNNHQDSKSLEDSEYEVIEEERIISTGYSFPKARRFEKEKDNEETPETEEVEVVDIPLDIERAKRFQSPHTPGPVMKPKVIIEKKKISTQSEGDQSEAESKSRASSPPLPIKVEAKALDFLSTRYRSPGVRFFPDSSSVNHDKRSQVDLATEVAERMRGPGYYSVDDKAINFTRKGTGKEQGTVIHKGPDHSRIPYAEAIKTAEKMLDESRGPGYYDIDQLPSSETKNRSALLYRAESKPTKQLERKKYFEEKAALRREEFLNPDDTVLRKRVSTVNFRSTKERFPPSLAEQKRRYREERSKEFDNSDRDSDSDRDYYDSSSRSWSRSKSMSRSRDHRYRRSRSYSDQSGSDDSIDAFQSWLRSSGNTSPSRIGRDSSRKNDPNPARRSLSAGPISRQLAYDVKYDAIERRPATGVSMKAEVVSREKTKEMVYSRPAAIESIMSNQTSDPQQKKFYGPSIPINWVPDKAAMKIPNFYEKMKKKRSGQTEEDVNEDESIAEIMRLLGEAPQATTAPNTEADPYTNAFLQSSYSGSSIKRPNRVQFQEHSSAELSQQRKKEKEAETLKLHQQLDFLTNQVPLDWNTPDPYSKLSTRYSQKAATVSFDKQTSRAKKKVVSKGMVVEEAFEDHHIEATDEMGPGRYDVLKSMEALKGNKGKGVIPFEKVISREDQIGAHGERPISAVEPLDEEGEDVEGREETAIDYGTAKDIASGRHKKKGIPLYPKDRYPVKEVEVNEEGEEEEEGGLDDHLGGSWFEGMAEQSKRKSNKHLEFGKMKGRDEEEKEKEKLFLNKMMKEEMNIDIEEHALDLEVKDAHPHKPRVTGVTISDPKKDPRFKEEKKSVLPPPERELTEEEIKRRQIDENPTAYGKKGVVIDMKKMSGRDDVDPNKKAEEQEMIDGLIHGEIDNEEGREIDKERGNAIDQAKENRRKPISRTIDFNKQLSSQRHKEKEDRDAERLIQEEIDEGRGGFVEDPEEPDIHAKKTIAASSQQKNTVNFQRMNKTAPEERAAAEKKVVNQEIFAGEGDDDEEGGLLDLQPKKAQKKVKGMVSFQKQGKEEIPHENSIQLDPEIPKEDLRKRDGETLKLKPVDPGQLKKGGHGFDNIPGRKNFLGGQLNPRDPDENPLKGKQSYQEKLQEELGLVSNNPNPSQPTVILEKTSKDAVKPRSQQVTVMKTTEPQVPISKEEQQRIAAREIYEKYDLEDPKQGEGKRVKTDPVPAQQGAAAVSSSKNTAAPGENSNGTGLKSVTAMKQKGTRLAEPYEEDIHKQLEKEIGMPLPRQGGGAGEGLIDLDPSKKDPLTLKQSQKNSNVSSMKKASSNPPFRGSKVLSKIPELQTEEIQLQTKDEIEAQQRARNQPNRTPSDATKPTYQGNTANRFVSGPEKKVIESLEKEQQEEVIIDQKNLSNKNPSRGGGSGGVASFGKSNTAKTATSTNNGKDVKQENLMAAMIDQSSDRQLQQILSKNQNISSKELILENVDPSSVKKSIPSASAFRQSSDRIQTPKVREAVEAFQKEQQEELILDPKVASAGGKNQGASVMKNQQSRIPSKQEDAVEKELQRETTEEVIIQAPNNDDGTRKKKDAGGGASAMKSKSVKTLTPAESAALEAFQKTVNENTNTIDPEKRMKPSGSSSSTAATGGGGGVKKAASSKTPAASSSSKSLAKSNSGNNTAKKETPAAPNPGQLKDVDNDDDEEELLVVKTPVVNNLSGKAPPPPASKKGKDTDELVKDLNKLKV